MAINFPATPTTNDEYSYNGRVWVFDGAAWQLKRTGNVEAGALTVTGTSNIADLNANGNISATATITSASIVSTATTASTSATTGALKVAGGVGIAGNIYTGGQIQANGLITADFITATYATFTGTEAIKLPVGNTAQRPGSATAGMFRFNTEANGFEVYDGTSWGAAGGGGNPGGNTAEIQYNNAGVFSGVGELTFDGTAVTAGNLIIATYANVTATTASTNTTSGALKVAGGVGIAGNVYVGGNENISGALSVTGAITGNVSGNASSATVLATARTIGGVSFDGSANINLPGVNTAGNQDTSGNAATATALATARTIGGVSFDGSANINLPGVNTAGNQDTSGTAAIATTATTVTLVATDTTNATHYPLFTAAAIGNENPRTDTGFTYNPSTGTLASAIFSGTATSAQYADLAERYTSDLEYSPGTVVVFGGQYEVTESMKAHDTAVAGIVSTDPAYLMNSRLQDGVSVALTGRVPCIVKGPVTKGTVLVTSELPGTAMAIDNSKFVPGCVIGKALESIEDDSVTMIEVAVGRF